MNFFNLCFYALLITKVLSSPSYFVGYINSVTQWAYPLEVCASIGLTGFQWVSCSADGSIAIVNSYSDSKCTSLTKSQNYTTASRTITGLYDFNCVGTDDYLVTTINAGSCSTTDPSYFGTITTYGVVNQCFGFTTFSYHNGTFLSYEKAQCNATHGLVDIYAYFSSYSTSLACSGTRPLSILNNVSVVYPTCTYYYTSLGIKVYAQVADCVYNGYSQLPQYYNNSADFTASSYKVGSNYNISFEAAPSTSAITADADVDLCGYNWPAFLEKYFPGCKYSLETQCTTYAADFDDTDLASIFVKAWVTCYTSNSQFTATSCSTSDLSSKIENTNVTVSDYQCTDYISKSAGHTQAINFIVLAICFIMSLYIF